MSVKLVSPILALEVPELYFLFFFPSGSSQDSAMILAVLLGLCSTHLHTYAAENNTHGYASMQDNEVEQIKKNKKHTLLKRGKTLPKNDGNDPGPGIQVV